MGVGLTPYRMRAVFNIAHLEVLEGDNLETANTFYLRQGNKTVELYTRSLPWHFPFLNDFLNEWNF